MEDTFILSQGLFIRLLGLVFLIAFWSLGTQARGLYGVRGITPIKNTLEDIRNYYGNKSFRELPVIFWANSSNVFIMTCIAAGMVSSLLVMLGIIPALFLFICWYLYYSFCIAGSAFLSFQWDILLLETGIVAIFFALMTPPPILVVVALWCVLFRLMFLSGITKYLWGSKEWHDLSVMKYHYETQPLPTPLAYYMHHMPAWFGKLSVVFVYFVELIVPFFIFFPVEIRLAAFFFLVLLQVFILLTGNYTYFNLLTIVLCVPLVPDQYLQWIGGWVAIQPLLPSYGILDWILNAIGFAFIFLAALSILGMFYRIGSFQNVLRFLKKYYILNSYGLFVQMTTWRDEIVIEGSGDGENWKEYAFKWKPGPSWVAPHQPRLDWQMWFVPLSIFEQNPWMEYLIFRLLEGIPEVTALFRTNPFPDSPPKYIRLLRYRYRFTNLKSEAWWEKEYVGHYGPDIMYSLK